MRSLVGRGPIVRGISLAIAASTLFWAVPGVALDETAKPPFAPTLDLAVPDAPAFKLIVVNPSSVLRPGTRREVAILLGTADRGNFAVELAPFWLARNGMVSLRELRDSKLLYDLEISTAVTTAEGRSREIALGIRLPLLDRSDPYANEGYLEQLWAVADRLSVRRREIRSRIMREVGPETFAALSREEQEDRIRREPEFATAAQEAEYAVERAKDEARATTWNAPIVELALAASGASPDATLPHLRAVAYAGWLSAGVPLGRGGQVLIGGAARLTRDAQESIKRREGSLGLRSLYGGNYGKGLLEVEFKWADDAKASCAGRAGAEIRLISGIWVDFCSGLEARGGATGTIRSKFNIRYATPEKRPALDGQ